MSQSAIPLGPQRYSESFGRHYEDFVVGDVYEHRPGRTITRGGQHLVHAADDEHPPAALRRGVRARHSEFGRCIVGSPADAGASWSA